MERIISYLFIFGFIGAMMLSCKDSRPSGEEGWLQGDTHEKFDRVADQLGGFSATMVEVGHRYQELYWAGVDQNWEYAGHQIEHIEEALEAGYERRPVRKPSGEYFMEFVIPEMEKAIERKDSLAFFKAFEIMTVNCNSCHAKENMAFMKVQQPEIRYSPIRK